MVNVMKGILVEWYDSVETYLLDVLIFRRQLDLLVDVGLLKTCDPAMKQFLLHLDETNALGKKFVIQDLDETHIFIASDILPTLHARIDDLMDKLHFPVNA